MGLKLVKGNLKDFQNAGFDDADDSKQLLFQNLCEEDKFISIASSIAMVKSWPGSASKHLPPGFNVLIRIKDLTDETFRRNFSRYQNIFRILEIDDKSIKCQAFIDNYHSKQMDLFFEFIKKITNDEFLSLVSHLFPKPRALTTEEIELNSLLPKLNIELFPRAFEIAKKINALKNIDSPSFFICDYADGLFLLGNACFEAHLFDEACEAFNAILDSNHYYESAMYMLGNLILEGIDLNKNDTENHEKLLEHLIYCIKCSIELNASFEYSSFLSKINKLSALENIPFNEFLNLGKEFYGLGEISIKLAESQFQLRKAIANPVREISHSGSLDIRKFSALPLPDLTKENWVLKSGNIEAFESDESEDLADYNNNLIFVNQSSNPYFTQISLERKNRLRGDLSIEISLPKMSAFQAESLMKENGDDLEFFENAYGLDVQGFFDLYGSRNGKNEDYCYKLGLGFTKSLSSVKKEEFDELFGYLEKRISLEMLEFIKKYLVPKALTPEEQSFEDILNSITKTSTRIDDVLNYVEKFRVVDQFKEELEHEHYGLFGYINSNYFNYDLIRAGKKYLTLELYDQAFQVLDLVDKCLYEDHPVFYAHYFLSKIKLKEIENSMAIDAREETTKKLVSYVHWVRKKSLLEQDYDLFIKLLKVHASILPASALERKFSLEYSLRAIKESRVRFLEFMLELSDGHYHLKNISSDNQSSYLSYNNNYSSSSSSSSRVENLMLSSQGQQAAFSSLPKVANKRYDSHPSNTDLKMKKVSRSYKIRMPDLKKI